MTKKTLILGANGGIGEALAKIYIDRDEGKDLVLTARNKDDLKYHKGDKHALDVLNDNEIENVLSEYADEPIKGFAYCIGSIDLKPLKATKDEEFLYHYSLNVIGVVKALRLLEKGLKRGNASIVLYSTIAVGQGFSNHALISTAKGAVEGLTRALAAEWAPKVRINCIAPSIMDTPLSSKLTGYDKMREALEAMHPIPKLGDAEEAAKLTAFLMNEDSSWINGQIMHMDGGRSSLRVKG